MTNDPSYHWSGAKKMFPEDELNRHNYRLRFMEMENKIKKCELERAELEQRFAQLMRDRQECERAAARQLKMKYKRMMELERERSARNESLLRMLHKIDQQATSLAAKTDRLKMLKTQYESYLIRSWSAQRSLPSCSPAPSMYYPQPQLCTMPHQTVPYQFPHRAADSPKSEFVRYLSDMTHAQTVSNQPIPPPTALSNYINHQQFPTHQLYGPSMLAPTPTFTQEPFIRPSPPDIPSPSNFISRHLPASPLRSPSTIAKEGAKQFELSNEEFIQYIDNEILKASSSTASTSADKERRPEIVIDPPTISSTPLPEAYLEDIANDADEELLKPPPGTSRFLDDSPLIEEIAEATAELELSDNASIAQHDLPALDMSDEADINQRWDKVIEMNSSIRPPSALPPQETFVEPSTTSSPLQDVIARTLRGVISEVEERCEAPAVSDQSETDDRELSTEKDVRYSYEQESLTGTSAAFGEMQPDYLQQSHGQSDVYQPEQYPLTEDTYPITAQDHVEATSPEYVAQQPEGAYNYDYGSTGVEQPIETDWSTARQSARTKSHTTPETIDEVIDNGDSSLNEKRSTPSGSKRASPTGENLPGAEIHSDVPVHAEQEQAPVEDQQQYDYSQYQQEYDTGLEYQQQDYVDQQAYYQEQYAAGDQSGQPDPSPGAQYREYSDVDPNQYQQATEYPGPTQYVFEQGYYGEQSQEQQPNQEQQGYYEDPNASEQGYYVEQQMSDPVYYDQSQEQSEYPTYGPAAVEEPPTDDIQQAACEGLKDEIKEQGEPPSTVISAGSVVDVDSTEQQMETKTSASMGDAVESVSPVKLATAAGNEDTTISSANDESDFDFSTQ